MPASSTVLAGNEPESKLLDCIDRGLDVFGTSVKNVIYFRFRTIYNSERSEIPRKPELFSESLRTFFGERGYHVESAIVASLVDEFHLTEVTYSDSLVRAIHEARKQLRS
jgi:hypothetical protein